MAAAQPPWPPPGSPQFAGVRDAWRDATLAEWFLHHPQGKALFRIWAAMQRARWQSPPSGAGAAGAPRAAPAGAPPRPAPSSRSEARAPDAARAGPSVPPRSEAQRRRQRRERAHAAAVAAAAAGQAGGGTAASDPAAAVRGAASAGGGPEPARPSGAHAPTQATAATTQAAAAGDELSLVRRRAGKRRGVRGAAADAGGSGGGGVWVWAGWEKTKNGGRRWRGLGWRAFAGLWFRCASTTGRAGLTTSPCWTRREHLRASAATAQLLLPVGDGGGSYEVAFAESGVSHVR